MSKEVLSKQSDRILAGVDKLADAVGSTLGPRGQNVIISKPFGPPQITKDGVTVAKEIDLPDPVMNMGAQLVKHVAMQTVDLAGDGTTTATVLARAIYASGLKQIKENTRVGELNRGIQHAAGLVVKFLKSIAKKIETPADVEQVATISTNGDKEIGRLIAQAQEKVGKNGLILAVESLEPKMDINVVEGMQLHTGLVHPAMVNKPEEMLAEFDNPLILVYEKKISIFQPIVKIIEMAIHAKRPLVIFCETMDEEALATWVVNKNRGAILGAAIRNPSMGHERAAILEDIAILTGATVVGDQAAVPLDKVEMKHLGSCGRLIAERDNTYIVKGNGDPQAIEDRVKTLSALLANSEEHTAQYNSVKERLAKLDGGVAMIQVGGFNEVEVRERKDRVEDAIHAVRAALAEGILPGGGVALIRARDVLRSRAANGPGKRVVMGAMSTAQIAEEYQEEDSTDFLLGMNVVFQALTEPFTQICKNAELDMKQAIVTIENAKDHRTGIDATTGKIVDMYQAGIVDPAKVTRVALENAASIAGLLLTTDSVIYDKNPIELPKPIRQ